MITEDYVSFETAKLLKEKGFNGECEYFYVNGKLVRAQGTPGGPYNWNAGETPFNECSAPTLQMAMKWLREKEIFVEVTHTLFSSPHKYQYSIFRTEPEFYITGDEHKSYEEACEAGIRYCLENLI